MSRGKLHILRNRQSTDFRDNQSSCGYMVLCSHYCFVDEIIHGFLPRRNIISGKAQDIRATLSTLKTLSKTIANAERRAISHDASAEIEIVADTKIILQSLFIKYFAFVEHCYGH
jgi:glutamate racemase